MVSHGCHMAIPYQYRSDHLTEGETRVCSPDAYLICMCIIKIVKPKMWLVGWSSLLLILLQTCTNLEMSLILQELGCAVLHIVWIISVVQSLFAVRHSFLRMLEVTPNQRFLIQLCLKSSSLLVHFGSHSSLTLPLCCAFTATLST